MLLTLLKAKIHRAVVTETNIEYVGSITIDENLLKAVDIRSYEQVHVWNLTNGSRLVTYALAGEAGSGIICLNGAGAHLNRVGDRVIIASFAQLDAKEADQFKPKIALVNQDNRIDQIIEGK